MSRVVRTRRPSCLPWFSVNVNADLSDEILVHQFTGTKNAIIRCRGFDLDGHANNGSQLRSTQGC